MKPQWRDIWPHLVIISLMFITAAFAWPRVPEQMPVHWNLAGEPDRIGSKTEALLILPLITAGMMTLLLWLPAVMVAQVQSEELRPAYRQLCLSLTLFLAGVQGLMLAAGLKLPFNFSTGICVMLALLFGQIGWLLPKLPPNPIAGIRTPWTLHNRETWDRTHRHARWVFLVLAGSFLFLGWFQTGCMLGMTVGIAILGGIWIIVVSSLSSPSA